MKKLRAWLDVDQAIKEYGLLKIKRDGVEGKANERIAALKNSAAQQIEKLDSQMNTLAEDVEAWCEWNRDEMKPIKNTGGSTWRGVFGKIAFRKCPPKIEILKKVNTVLAALKSRKLLNCIRTTEAIDKDAMQGLDDKTLKAVGAQRGAAEKFEIKPDYTRIEKST